MAPKAMPTAILSPCFDLERGSVRALNTLPPGRIWIPAHDLPTALRALELLCTVQNTRQFPRPQLNGDLI